MTIFQIYASVRADGFSLVVHNSVDARNCRHCCRVSCAGLVAVNGKPIEQVEWAGVTSSAGPVVVLFEEQDPPTELRVTVQKEAGEKLGMKARSTGAHREDLRRVAATSRHRGRRPRRARGGPGRVRERHGGGPRGVG